MSKNSYVNANLISTYDTFANWLTKTNDIIYDMGTSVVTTNSSATPDITTGNGYVNGFFGSNTFYVFTALHGGTPTALANLNITSNLYISSNTTVAANLVVIGTANVTVNLNSVGIVANNITANNNLIVTNTAVLNTATAVIANIATANIATLGVTGTGTVLNLNVTNVANLNNANVVSANITTLGVTGLATFVNASVGTGTSNVQANTTQIRISNPSAVATVNATTFSGTAANATNLNSQPGSFYTNASNINAGNLPWAHVAANTVNTTGAFTITGVYTHNANIVVNTANHLVVGNATVNATANQTTFYVANSTTNTSINPGIITFGGGATVNNTVYSGTANNSLALAGYIANNAVPSDGFVLAWNQAESRIKWTNPSGISTALNSNAIVANASLQAGSNGTVFVLTAEGNTTSTNLVMRANNISLTVDSGAVLFNSNAFVNSAVLSVGNTTANVTVNTTVITVGNSSVNATINSTAFSRQANGATNLGPEGSGVNLSTLQTQITGNAATAYANAVANSANAGNITTGTLDAGRLPATVVNTSGAFTITGVHTHNANIFMNTASQILIGTASVNAVANQTTLAIYNASSNLVANASTINFAGGAATVNSTVYSRQSNGASFLGPEGSGVNLSTLQSQFTSNDATTYSNATTFASNATNITTGTLSAGRLPSTIVNTSASFTLAGDMTYSGTARFNANVGFNVAPGTNSSRFNVLFPTTTNSTDVLLVQKTRDSANAARYGFTDVGGLTTDSNGGAFWRGFHFAAPSITDGAAVAQFPRLAIAAETETLTNPSTRRWLFEAGNDSATSRYSIVLRTAATDRLIVDGVNGNVGIGVVPSAAKFDLLGPSTGTAASDVGMLARIKGGTTNIQGIDILNIRNSAGSDWTTTGTRLHSFVDSTFMSYMQFNGNNNNNGISWGTGGNTTDRNTIAERMRIDSGGNVAIGTTTTTTHRLNVNGSINATNADFSNLITANSGIYRATASGPAYWLQQDGTGRSHWYWNSAGGTSPLFSYANEDASALTIGATATGAGGSFFHRSADGTGKAAGAALTWTTTLYVDLNTITWKGSAVAVANGATYNLTANNATNIGGTDTQTVIASLRANRALCGGGTITVDASNGNIKWNNRFIVISNGLNSNFSTSGYFDIVCPDGVTAGQTSVTGVGGATNKTVTTAGIPLAAWEALYYILPIGSSNAINYSNFRVASYTSALDIPSTWVLICFRNGDNGAIYFNNGVTLYQGQSYNTNTQSSVTINATSLGGVASSGYAAISGASFTGNVTLQAGLFEKAVDVGAGTAFNMNSGTYFYKTISGSTTFTVSNAPASGTVASFTVELTNGGSAAITWMTGTKWAGGTAPSLTTSGKDILVFVTRDGGTTWYGSASILNAA